MAAKLYSVSQQSVDTTRYIRNTKNFKFIFLANA